LTGKFVGLGDLLSRVKGRSDVGGLGFAELKNWWVWDRALNVWGGFRVWALEVG
jgi:hypothetical protein